jgi:hypothetical protein
MSALDRELLAAHAASDRAALVALYRLAADESADADQAAFYLTHAHVFALEMGHPEVTALRARLVAAGRESPLPPPRPPLR